MAYESRLSLTVDTRTGQRSLKQLEGSLRDVDRAGGRTSRQVDRVGSDINRLRGMALAASGALAGLASAISVREIVQMSDAWQNAANQLRQVTNDTETLERVQRSLTDVARDTRSNFESTANLYARLARSTTELGLSQSDLIDLTTTINQSFAVSGATAGEAAAAITQLSQGLAAGALRGDEFNSVAEQAPGIMRAIAESLGMTIGELRSFAAEGGITAEIVVSALQEASSEIDATFGQSIATFGQRLENARTNLVEWVGESDRITSAVSTLGESIEGLSENLDTIATAAGGVALVVGGRLTASLVSVTAAKAAATQQAIAYLAALARMAGVSRVASAATGALGGAMALVGGPVGLAIVAAGSLYYFRDSLFASSSEASQAEQDIRGLASGFKDLTVAQIENERNSIESQMRKNADAIAEARLELERLREAQAGRRMTNTLVPGGTAGIVQETEIQAQINELNRLNEAHKDNIRQLNEREESLSKQNEERSEIRKRQAEAAAEAEIEAARRAAEAWNRVRQSSYDALHGLLDEIDPVGAELRQLTANIAIVQDAFARGFIDAEQADAIVNALNDPKQWEDAGKESAEAFINPWQSAADSVAQSLQDAIASGDWDSIGDAIGGALGSSIAAIVNKQVTDSLAKSITADSGMFAQIGAAFAGPIAGAVAGGVAQLAIAEVSGWLSSSGWDPTEARQAAQGTRTILGDMDAKSESIRRAVEGSESGIGQLVGINQNMLRALQSVQAGIGGASARVARGAGGTALPGVSAGAISGSDFALTGGVMPIFDATLGAAFDFFDKSLNFLSFGMFDLGGMLGGKSRQVDEGVQIIGGYIEDLIDDTIVNAYATFRVKKHAFSSTKTKERFQRIGGDVEQQFALVFESVFDSVEQAAMALGMGASSRMRSFRVDTQRLSLEGLSAAQQTAEIEAYFGTVFDNLAGYAIPWLDDFQQAGEGLGETLARVANQTMVTQEAVNRLGIQFSDLAGRELVVASERLMDAAGGVEQFITSMQGFIGNFASDAQKFELAYSDISRALAQSNLILPSTRDGYYDLLQAQNGATAAGAENIATLLRLQGVADQYYTYLEDAQSEALKAEEEMQRERLSLNRELLQIQRNAISESLREAEAASGAVERALAGLTIQSSSFARLSRDAALASLQGMAASGRIGDQGQLDRALSAATNIQAGEFSTMNDYIRGVSRTGETLRDLKWVTDQQLTREQRSLANIERQMEAMNEEISAVGRATAKHTAKTAKLLERIEVEGLEVRA